MNLITEEEFEKEKEQLMEDLASAHAGKEEIGVEDLITFLIEQLVTLRVKTKKLATEISKIEPF